MAKTTLTRKKLNYGRGKTPHTLIPRRNETIDGGENSSKINLEEMDKKSITKYENELKNDE